MIARRRHLEGTPRANAKVKSKLAYAIRKSATHGRGAFATRTIRKGAKIIEYRGKRSSYDEACEKPDSDPSDPFHTLLFEVSDGSVIDAGMRGSAAKWINHSCAPNCEPIEHDDFRVFIHAKRTIHAGEELALRLPSGLSRAAEQARAQGMACRCGSRELPRHDAGAGEAKSKRLAR